MGDAGFILGRRARRRPRAFGKNENLAPLGDRLRHLPRQVGQRLAAPRAVDGDLFGALEVPAEHRDLQQFALQHESEVVHLRGESEGLECGLMFRGDDAGALGKVLMAAKFDLCSANLVEEPERIARPQPRKLLHGGALHQKGRQAQNRKDSHVGVK